MMSKDLCSIVEERQKPEFKAYLAEKLICLRKISGRQEANE